MPILFIHGVAVRREGDPAWAQVRRLTGSVQWPGIEASLREHVAPSLNKAAPEQVSIREVYWGDLGAYYALEGRSLGSWQDRAAAASLDDLSDDAIGTALEQQILPATPTVDWPVTLATIWDVARDENLRDIACDLPQARQMAFLVTAVQARLPQLPLRERMREQLEVPRLPRTLVRQRRLSLSRTLTTFRRPIEDFVPLFMGDVMAYLTGRGTPGQPGRIVQRVLDGLFQARADALAQHRSGQPNTQWAGPEPLVVLTHSMGGQLLYDALTAFLPADPRLAQSPDLKVDFWCASASQVGLFRELNMFLEQQPLPTPALRDSPHAGYFWNVWSYSDLLSFRAEGVIQGAHDTVFPFLGDVRQDHLSYLSTPAFYRALGAKVRIHLGSKQNGQRR